MKNKGKNSNYKNNAGAPPPMPQRKNAPSPEELQAKMDKSKKKLIKIAPVFLIVLTLVFITIKRPPRMNVVHMQHSYKSFYSEVSGKSTLVVDGRAAITALMGELRGKASVDGGVYAAIENAGAADGGALSIYSPDGNTLYRSENSAVDFALSPDGTAALYYSSTGDAAFLIDIAAGQETEVPGSRGGNIRDLRISPDGKTALCGSDTGLFVWNGTDTRAVSGDFFPISVSNSGERVYAVRRSDNALCRAPGDGSVIELLPDIDIAAPMIMSFDGTQLLVHDSAGQAHIITGDGTHKVGGEGGVTLPIDIGENAMPEPFGFTYGGTLFTAVYTTHSNGEYALYATGDDGASKRFIADSESDILVRANGSSAYFVKNGELTLFQNSTKNGSNNELDSNVTTRLVIDAKKESVYYINDTGELRTLKGKGNPKLIADGAEDVKAAFTKGAYYTTSGGELYYYDGKNSVKIASGVTAFDVTPYMVYYFDEFADVYASSDGIAFTRVAENVRVEE
ncbi:MAG: PQQ-like beta-propeller repeat protein [Oscillospiraceae bacterium]|jgi:hypothetical protein|nr:PQQ-like beta-propeller repeat protein [Oscillospiraceae bacterium]